MGLIALVLKIVECVSSARDDLRERYLGGGWEPAAIDILGLPLWCALEIVCFVTLFVFALVTLPRQAGGEAHAKQFKRLRRVVQCQGAFLGILIREATRKQSMVTGGARAVAAPCTPEWALRACAWRLSGVVQRFA